jgi:hypothetical protein
MARPTMERAITEKSVDVGGLLEPPSPKITEARG